MRTHVAVLRGGPGDEHDVSLKTGANVIERLQREPYKTVDVYIDRNGIWHVRGVPMEPERALRGVDVVFNALHGQYGEDGGVQRELERHGVPYTGSGAFASAAAMNKTLAKELLAKHGIKMPRHRVLRVTPELESEAREAFAAFSPPIIVKPSSSGSSVGVTLAKTWAEFWEGVKKAFEHSKDVLVEEFIKGREATAGVVDRLRGKDVYELFPIEIIPPAESAIFDYDAKYSGKSIERVPGNFTREESEELQRLAKVAHEGLGLRHYSRSDFIVSPRGVYYLETNTLPGLTSESLIPKSLAAAGISMDEFLDHIIEMALKKK